MDLILWRHADAGPPVADPNDDLERALTSKGERQAKRMSQWLSSVLPSTLRLLSSPALRCTQTAAALGGRIERVPALGPQASVESVLAAARWPHSQATVVVVSHQPTLGRIAAFLMAGETARAGGASWTIDKGGAWWLRHRKQDERSEVVLVAVRSPESL